MKNISIINIFKKIFTGILILIVFALLYVLLLLGESDSNLSSTNEGGSKIVAGTNIIFNGSNLNEIYADFYYSYVYNSTITPNNVKYTSKDKNRKLEMVYQSKDGFSYKLNLNAPKSNLMNTDMSNYTIVSDKNISVAGLIGVWMENDDNIIISSNTTNTAITFIFPKLDDDKIKFELSLYNLNNNKEQTNENKQ